MRVLFFSVMLTISLQALSQQVPNGNFESWYNESNYQNPTYWDTPNSTTGSLNVFCVQQENSIVQNGTAAAKIQSKSIFGTPIPGLVTLGDFNVNIINFASTIEGGYSFTYKPTILKGFYQYEPINGDQAFVGVLLLKQNANAWDTIAQGNFKTTSTALNWTPFTININYSNLSETPTHLNIIVLSSDKDAPQPNSTLYIDNLTFEYPLNSETSSLNKVQLYTYHNKVIINNSEPNSQITVFNSNGQIVFDKNIHDANYSFNIEQKGMYFVCIKSNQNMLNKKIAILEWSQGLF
ncbi:MAG: hypothetical protein Fur0028_04690 [Bacteroidales bacterium]